MCKMKLHQQNCSFEKMNCKKYCALPGLFWRGLLCSRFRTSCWSSAARRVDWCSTYNTEWFSSPVNMSAARWLELAWPFSETGNSGLTKAMKILQHVSIIMNVYSSFIITLSRVLLPSPLPLHHHQKPPNFA